MKHVLMPIAAALLALNTANVFAQTESNPSQPTNAPARQAVEGQAPSPGDLALALETVNAFIEQLKTDARAPGYALLTPETRASESEDDWDALINQLHDRAGERQDSRFAFALRTDSLPQAEPGNYVVIGLNTNFATQKLTETIILQSVDGRYMISGYHFQDRKPAG